MTDGELVRRTLQGDGAAGNQLVQRWQARLVGFCHARIGRADAAEELAQETMFRALRSLGKLEDHEKLAAWLRGIASRVCVDWIRQKTKAVPFSTLSGGNGHADNGHLEDRLACEQDGAEQVALRDEEHARLRAAINRLQEPYREAIMIYYYDGEPKTYARVAEMLGVSSATVNLRLTKARAMLRADLAAVKSGR